MDMSEQRLVDAVALSERLKDLDEWCRDLRKPGIEQARCIVQEAPTIDAVQVVRCKQCKFWKNDGKHITGLCLHSNVGGLKLDTDYCSYGTQKDKEDANHGN
jgi:hypothetical protein